MDASKESVMTKKNGISVPEGYFENLSSRLASISGSAAPVRKVSFVQRVAPYLAYAASLAAIALLASAIIRKTAVPEQADSSLWEENLVAEVLMTGDPYAFIYESEAINP